MGGKLLYRDSNGREASVDIAPEGVFMGRGADCAVRTDDAMVSRKNCKIALAGGRFVVEDLGSSNGTFVNEVRVQRQALNHADVVRCGTLQVRFVETADSPAQRPQPAAQKPKTMSLEPQGVVDVHATTGGLNPASLMAQKDAELRRIAEERDALAARLREASAELESAQEKTDAGGVEAQRLRVENAAQRDRLTVLQREKSLADDEIHALTKAGNELRDELETLKGEHVAAKQHADELSDELSARDRQLERAHEDVQRAKQSIEEMRGQLAEVQRTKDEGWKELNTRITELDQLREVIKEQERILGEQKVGLMSLEAAVKDGRGERDRIIREQIAIKNERDELRDKVVRQQHQIEALEEEQRRLGRMLSEAGSASASSGASSDELVRLGQELRELKVQLKTSESERARLAERLLATESERKELDAKHAKLDVERAQALQQKGTIDAARSRLEDRLAKAEAARLKAEEALATAQAGLEQAKASSDRLMVEVEREKKRASELELELARTHEAIENAPKHMVEAARHPELLSTTAEIAVPPEARIHELEDEISRLQGLIASALHEDDSPTNVRPRPAENGAHASEIKKKAEEAYTVINDALSELRTNILLAKDLVAEHGHAVPGDAGRTLEDAINVSVDRAEDAKGVLRELRRVIES